jgi:hypothetical protein
MERSIQGHVHLNLVDSGKTTTRLRIMLT